MAEQKDQSTEDIIINSENENEIIEQPENSDDTVVDSETLALGDDTETQPADLINSPDLTLETATLDDAELDDTEVADDAPTDNGEILALGEETETQPVDVMGDASDIDDEIDETELVNDVPADNGEMLALGEEVETQPADPVDIRDENISDNDAPILVIKADFDPESETSNSVDTVAETATENVDNIETNTVISNVTNLTDAVVTPAPEASPTVAPSVYPKSSTDGVSTMKPPEITPQNTLDDYQVMPESSWPPPMFVRRNITPQERYYLEQRWHSQWRFFDKKANDAKRLYLRLQRIIVIGSVTVPVLVSLDPDIVSGSINIFLGLFNLIPGLAIPDMTSVFARILIDAGTVVLSLSVAIAAGLESLNKYGDNWSSYRQAAEELQAEKSFYDVSGGRYSSNPDSFSRFVERTEEIIAQTNGRFIVSIDKQTQEAEKRADSFLGTEKDKEQGTTIETEVSSYSDAAAG